MAQKNSSIESINRFSFKILKQIQNQKNNCFYSPLSIYEALSMAYAGARENTKLEMEKVMGINDTENFHQNFLELTNSLGLEREFTLLISNSLWLQKSLKPEKEYIRLVEGNYKAKVEDVNFASENDREKARLKINEWIEKQTKGNLPDFMPKGLIDESTITILINAVYFNALWNTIFPEEKLSTENFIVSVDDSVKCRMMNLTFDTNYYEDEMMQVLEIPYQNKKSTMMVFLPKKGIEDSTLIFDYDYLKKVASSMSSHKVNLSLPKFKMATSYELSESLKNMGLKAAFEPGADFSGITGNKSLILDKVLHKSVIDVSEKGTEAASSTAVISMRSTTIVKESIEFKANRPFYFLIKENPGHLIFFMGYLARPQAVSE